LTETDRANRFDPTNCLQRTFQVTTDFERSWSLLDLFTTLSQIWKTSTKQIDQGTMGKWEDNTDVN